MGNIHIKTNIFIKGIYNKGNNNLKIIKLYILFVMTYITYLKDEIVNAHS